MFMKNTPQLQSCWENRIPFPYIINLTFRTFQFGIPFLIFFIFKALLAIYVLVWLIIYVDPGIVGFPRILDTERSLRLSKQLDLHFAFHLLMGKFVGHFVHDLQAHSEWRSTFPQNHLRLQRLPWQHSQ